MSVLKIERLGAPVLRQRAAEIGTIDETVRLLVADMFETMYAAEGIGLAAPQVGIAKRILVVDVKDEQHPRFALVNPRIERLGEIREKAEEGCLSIPGVSSLVERPVDVVVTGVDEEGHPVRIEADGLLARCLQHEIDHLNGVLFIDHLSALKRSILLKKYRQVLADEREEAGASESSRPR